MRSASKPPLDDETVAEFLADNSEFLIRRPELLPDAAVGGASGTVVSLADRQVAVLRQRNEALRDRLGALLTAARDNDRTFARMRELTLALMDAADEAALDRLLAQHLVAGLDADHAACFVRRVSKDDLEHITARVVGAPWNRLFEHPKPTCGAFRPDEYALLFPGAELSGPGSAAVIPMPNAGAALAIGSKQAERFSPDMGKLFLSFLGDVLSRTLVRLNL